MAKKKVRMSVADLDLSYIEAKLTDENDRYGWSISRAKEAIDGYRAFLQFIQEHFGERHRVPGPDIDEVWHTHILHTRQYAKDCERLFGAFLHHTPRKRPKGSSEQTSKKTRALARPRDLEECRNSDGECVNCDGGPVPRGCNCM